MPIQTYVATYETLRMERTERKPEDSHEQTELDAGLIFIALHPFIILGGIGIVAALMVAFS